jgi:hypothetical protein
LFNGDQIGFKARWAWVHMAASSLITVCVALGKSCKFWVSGCSLCIYFVSFLAGLERVWNSRDIFLILLPSAAGILERLSHLPSTGTGGHSSHWKSV